MGFGVLEFTRPEVHTQKRMDLPRLTSHLGSPAPDFLSFFNMNILHLFCSEEGSKHSLKKTTIWEDWQGRKKTGGSSATRKCSVICKHGALQDINQIFVRPGTEALGGLWFGRRYLYFLIKMRSEPGLSRPPAACLLTSVSIRIYKP